MKDSVLIETIMGGKRVQKLGSESYILLRNTSMKDSVLIEMIWGGKCKRGESPIYCCEIYP
jgi:hypothetical protein